MIWIGFIAGIFTGIIFTFLVLGICSAAAAGDEMMDRDIRKINEKK